MYWHQKPWTKHGIWMPDRNDVQMQICTLQLDLVLSEINRQDA
jgi:hypothetical protein